jgi:hypothetical protein
MWLVDRNFMGICVVCGVDYRLFLNGFQIV